MGFEKESNVNLKAVILSTDYPPLTGGIAAYSNGIAKGLSIYCKVTVLAPKIGNFREFDQRQLYKTIRVVNFPVIREILFLLASSWLAITKKIDFIYNTAWFPCGVISLVVYFLFGTSYYVAAHASEILDDEITLKRRIKKKLRRLKNLVLKNAKFVFPVSNFTKQRLIEMDVPSEKIIIIPDGVDPEQFHPQVDTFLVKRKYGLEGKKIILTVARLDKHKGHEFVLRAMCRGVIEKFPNTVYLIVGDGPERNNLEDLVKDLDLRKNVIFTGLIKDYELSSFYNSCDVFVMPSYEIPRRTDLIEGFGVSYLEANACGKPVIGGKSGGVSDAIIDGQTGLLVEPTLIEELSETMCKLLSNKDYASSLGQQGRKRIETLLNWKTIGKQIINIIGAN